MASTAQVGRGIGSVLGLAFGFREGDRRRKKRLKAKADLDEEALQRARDKEARAAQLAIFLKGDRLAPEQEQKFLTSQGFEPTVGQKLSREALGLGLTPLDPEEQQTAGEFQAEQNRKAAEIRRRQQLGLTRQPLAGLIEKGSVKESGFERGPGDIAGQRETEAKTELLEQKLVTEIQRGEAQKQLAAKRKRVESAIASGKKSEQMSALRTLQSGFVTRIKSLDRIIEFDPFDAEEGTNTARQERASLLEELLGVTKELQKIGRVKEGESAKVSRGTADRLTTLKTMRRKKLINDENFKLQIKQLFDEKKISPEQALEALTK